MKHAQQGTDRRHAVTRNARRRTAVGFACVVLTAACGGPPPPVSTHVRIPTMQEFMGVGFPLEAGPYSAMGVQRYLDPKRGISIRYVALHSRATADIDVYPAGQGVLVAEDAADSVIQAEFTRAKALWHERLGSGLDLPDSVLELETGPDTISGMRADRTVTREGSATTFSLLVFLKAGHFIKVRNSVARKQFPEASEELHDLSRAFLGTVRP